MQIEFKEVDMLFHLDHLTGPVCVLGAGPSMDKYQPDHFTQNYVTQIGVNWTYEIFRCSYTVATHFVVVKEFADRQKIEGSHESKTTLVYSRQTSDIQCMANNPKADGIVFDAYRDLWLGSSTVITAIHFASFFSREIHLYGIDLERANDEQMYCKGYRQENGNKPTNDHFDDWAKVIKLQIDGLEKILGVSVVFMK